MRWQALAAGSTALALAALSFLAAAGNARDGLAMVAMFSPLPTDGVALARQSSRVLALAETAAMKGESTAQMRPMIVKAAAAAQLAFLREPLSAEALRNVALLRAKAGDAANQQSLMLLAGKLSRRDAGINLWLAQNHGKRGDIRMMFDWLDYALRTSTSAAELIVPALLKTAQDPSGVAPLTSLLAKNPPWADELWNAVDDAKGAYVNLARVRTNLHEKGIRLDPQHDEKLMLLLVGQGNFAEAESLASAVPRQIHAGPGGDGELLTDAGFAGLPALPPFGWQLFRDSDLDVYIDAARGTLHIGVFGDAGGTVARQLVKLPPARLGLTAALQGNAARISNALSVSLECAQAGRGRAPQRIEFEGSRASAIVAGGGSDCSYYWLNINVQPPANGNAFEADLDLVSLRAIGDAN